MPMELTNVSGICTEGDFAAALDRLRPSAKQITGIVSHFLFNIISPVK